MTTAKEWVVGAADKLSSGAVTRGRIVIFVRSSAGLEVMTNCNDPLEIASIVGDYVLAVRRKLNMQHAGDVDDDDHVEHVEVPKDHDGKV